MRRPSDDACRAIDGVHRTHRKTSLETLRRDRGGVCEGLLGYRANLPSTPTTQEIVDIDETIMDSLGVPREGRL